MKYLVVLSLLVSANSYGGVINCEIKLTKAYPLPLNMGFVKPGIYRGRAIGTGAFPNWTESSAVTAAVKECAQQNAYAIEGQNDAAVAIRNKMGQYCREAFLAAGEKTCR